MQDQDDRIPVTLLTGFLGAGKTTLLNHLIRDPDAGRIAVIMNELGDVGLDHDLIEEATEDTILMQSGCLCCSIRGDLAETMLSLVMRRRRGKLAFDRVVIETTGMADPGPILQVLTMDDFVALSFHMDGVIALADAVNGPGTLDRQFEAVNQIAVADLVVVTKGDLVLPPALARFEARLAAINPTARRVRADHGRVPAGALFDLTGTRAAVAADQVMAWLGAGDDASGPLAGLSGLPPSGQAAATVDPAASRHDSRIVTASVTIADPIDADAFDDWLNALVMCKGADLLRMKGIVHVAGVDAPFVLHGVQHVFDRPVPLKTWPAGDTTSRVVVIARDMDRAKLQAGLDGLRLPPDPAAIKRRGMLRHTTEMPF